MKTKILLIIFIGFVALPLLSLAIPKGLDQKANSQHQPERGQPEELEEVQPEKLEEAQEAQNKDIAEVMPSGRFLFPSEGAKLKKKIEIKFKVENADSVEFYLRRPESLTEVYLGQGNLVGKDTWSYSWETNSTPNGSYFLFPKITNEYGDYSGKKIEIEIKNKIKEEKEVQEIEQETKKAKAEIQKGEKEVEEKKEQSKQEAEKEVNKVAEKARELVKEEEKEELGKEIKQKAEKTGKEIKEKIEEAVEEKEKEKREKIKEEIKEKVEEFTESVVKASEKNKRKEALELKREVKENIGAIMKEVEKTSNKKQELEKKKQEVLAKDSDQDGIPDHEELRLKTNPLNPDSDGDGFLDGTEIKLGFNALNPSPADKVKYQEPTKVKIKPSKILKVEKVNLSLKKEEEVLEIQGKALPHSFVTLYIYSLPMVVVTKAGPDGNWQYVLDKPLVDGEHEVYATVTNNYGEIEEKSEPLKFVKKGKRVMRLFQSAKAEVVSPAETLQKSFIILVIAIIVFTLGIVLIGMGLILRKKSSPKP